MWAPDEWVVSAAVGPVRRRRGGAGAAREDGGDYEVEAAYGGREALRKVEENPYDVIILDIMMPDMDGLEVLRRIKETHPDLDVIMVTGLPQNATVVEAKKLGASDYISKPVEPDELKLIVQRTLGRG